MYLLELAAGALALYLGGEALVRGAVAIARHLSVSPLLIGLTLVGFGTSTPELITCIQAALAGSQDIAIGNVVGSNICNIALILGVAAVVSPMKTQRDAVLRDGSAMLVASVVCTGIVLHGLVSRPLGIALLAALAAFVTYTYMRERNTADPSAAMHAAEADVVERTPEQPWIAAALGLAGLLLVLAGARWFVSGAVTLAQTLGVSESVIGLTVVALGTSLPELVTAVVASLRGQADVAFGNVIGSNIFNVLGILGATAVVHPLMVPPDIARVDIWIMLAAALILMVFALSERRIARSEGVMLLAAYAAYLMWLASGA